MDIILVPGLWLDGSTWDAVTPALTAAGHRAHALTLPGMESRDADRSAVGLDDHVAAVVATIDAAEGPVLLVGHSVGVTIAHAAVDARPERVARHVQVGGFPGPDGSTRLADLVTEGATEVPMPDWVEMGEDANVVDFSPEALTDFYAAAIPVPARVLTDPVRLTDERRYDVPVTAVCPEYTADDLKEWLEAGHVPELAAIGEVEFVDLPGGHWPQVTQPDALARVILAAIG